MRAPLSRGQACLVTATLDPPGSQCEINPCVFNGAVPAEDRSIGGRVAIGLQACAAESCSKSRKKQARLLAERHTVRAKRVISCLPDACVASQGEHWLHFRAGQLNSFRQRRISLYVYPWDTAAGGTCAGGPNRLLRSVRTLGNGARVVDSPCAAREMKQNQTKCADTEFQQKGCCDVLTEEASRRWLLSKSRLERVTVQDADERRRYAIRKSDSCMLVAWVTTKSRIVTVKAASGHVPGPARQAPFSLSSSRTCIHAATPVTSSSQCPLGHLLCSPSHQSHHDRWIQHGAALAVLQDLWLLRNRRMHG